MTGFRHRDDESTERQLGGDIAEWYASTSPDAAARVRHLSAIADALAAHPSEASDTPVASLVSIDHVPRAASAGSRGAAVARQRERRDVSRIARVWTSMARAAAALVVVAGLAYWVRDARRSSSAAGALDARVSRASGDSGAVGISLGTPTASSASLADPSATSPISRNVDFSLRLADAAVRHVTLAGDFNGWDATALPMRRDPSDGMWHVHVALTPGRHVYSFVVDGIHWVIDPLAPRTHDEALGAANVIAVTGES